MWKADGQDEAAPGYRFDNGGQQQDMNESMAAAGAALGLAVIFIYLILASQFGSFLQPLAIMASLPLSLAGVIIALLVTGTTLNLFSIIGFIMLMGLVTKKRSCWWTSPTTASARTTAARGAAAGRAGASAADHHDHHGDDLRHAADGQRITKGGELLAPMGRAVIAASSPRPC